MPLGQHIEAELRRQERSVAWFSRRLCCTRTNVYRLFEKDTLDVSLLFRISRILHYDFFQLYTAELKKELP